MTRIFVALCIGALLGLLGACGEVRFKGERPDGNAAMTAAAWPFVPVTLRLHPFTTFVPATEDEPAVLEARIELLDQQGDVIKGIGQWRFEVYAMGERASQAGQERQLYVWSVPMVTLAENRRHYDPITRTYSFNLKFDQPPPTERKLELRVQLTDPAGNRLTTRGELGVGG